MSREEILVESDEVELTEEFHYMDGLKSVEEDLFCLRCGEYISSLSDLSCLCTACIEEDKNQVDMLRKELNAEFGNVFDKRVAT